MKQAAGKPVQARRSRLVKKWDGSKPATGSIAPVCRPPRAQPEGAESAPHSPRPLAGSGEMSQAAIRQQADALYETGRFAEAAAAYERCLETAPDDWDALNNLGNCRFRMGDYEQAERLYQRVIDAGRAKPPLYRNLGVSLARQHKVDDAIFALESYAENNPEDVEASGFLGDLYYDRRDYELAIDQYEKVVERQPNRPDTLTRLADCHLNCGAMAAALLAYESALNADPEYQPAWNRLHNVRAQLLSRINRARPHRADPPGGGKQQTPCPQRTDERLKRHR